MKVNTNHKAIFGGMMALTLLGTLTPLTANAQDDRDQGYRRDRDYNHNRDYQDNRDYRRDRDYNYNRERQDNRDYRYDRDRRDRDDYSGWSEEQRRDWLSRHRRESKNEWRNIAIGAGALSALGFLTHENFLGFAGAAGALYSLNRYEQDRRSESREDRLRAAYFNHPYFYRDGVRYERRLVRRGGERYYQFVRADRDYDRYR
jgi:hypothetical protein